MENEKGEKKKNKRKKGEEYKMSKEKCLKHDISSAPSVYSDEAMMR